mgnify:FL=1
MYKKKLYITIIYVITLLLLCYLIISMLDYNIIDSKILEKFDTSYEKYNTLLENYKTHINFNNYNTLNNDYTNLNTRYNQKNFGINIDDNYSTEVLLCNNLNNITDSPDDITGIPNTYTCIDNNNFITKQPRIINGKEY